MVKEKLPFLFTAKVQAYFEVCNTTLVVFLLSQPLPQGGLILKTRPKCEVNI
jgi:hypothetical protein